MSAPDLRQEVERFLYLEARLLDQGRFHAWLDLLTDDVRYWIPIRETLQGDREGLHPDDGPVVAHVDDDRAGLELRVKRLDTGMAHVETPPSRTRHFVTNVEVVADDGDEVTVLSNLLLFQGRRSESESLLSASRSDRLRRVDGQWRLAARKVVLDHTVLPRSISVFL